METSINDLEKYVLSVETRYNEVVLNEKRKVEVKIWEEGYDSRELGGITFSIVFFVSYSETCPNSNEMRSFEISILKLFERSHKRSLTVIFIRTILNILTIFI